MSLPHNVIAYVEIAAPCRTWKEGDWGIKRGKPTGIETKLSADTVKRIAAAAKKSGVLAAYNLLMYENGTLSKTSTRYFKEAAESIKDKGENEE